MSTSSLYRGPIRRALAACMAWLMLFAQLAMAVTTPLADIPIAAKVSAKPNIMYTLDDSGSMKYNFLPDFLTSVSSILPLTGLTRAAGPAPGGLVATATGSSANLASLSVGDLVTINGVLQPEFNGTFVVTGKTATTFTYTLASLPALTSTSVDPNYPSRQFVISSAYCRTTSTQTWPGGNLNPRAYFSAPCGQQSLNIDLAGNTSISRMQRTAATTVATATTTAAFITALNIGDFVTIQGTNTVGVCSNAPDFWGYVQVTAKPTATTFQYTVIAGPAFNQTGCGFSVGGTGGTWAHPPMHAADFNRLAYNPAVTYVAPWVYDAGHPTGMALQNTGTDANGNYATTAARWASASVDRDPFCAYEIAAGATSTTAPWCFPTATPKKDNLDLKVNVNVYCNTDWPTLLNDGFWPAGPNGIKVQDVGDANGQSTTTSGGWCRINGNDYSANAGAPATTSPNPGYNYPWEKTSGASDPKYFYLLLPNKVLWCDMTSPYRPRNPTVITGCKVGTPVYAGLPQTQRCVRGGNVCNPTVASRNYTPAACKTDPANLYCAPGVGGSDSNSPGTGALPECMACTCNADTANTNGNCRLDATGTGGSGVSCTAPFTNANPTCTPFPTAITGCGAGGVPIYQTATPLCLGTNYGSNQSGLLWDPVANSPSGVAPSLMAATTLLDDSNNAGVVCRHNNIAYTVGTVTSNRYTYPRTALGDVAIANQSGWSAPYTNQTGAFTTAVTASCPTVGTTVAIPRHYYTIEETLTDPATGNAVSVLFCDDYVQTANDPWRGFGQGVCQVKNDLQRFKNVKFGRFVRHDLFAGNPQGYPANGNGVARSWLDATTPTPDNSESVNYANWYAYYSTRLAAAKTTSSVAFSYLTTPPSEPIAYRVGFHNLGEESPPNGTDSTSASIKLVNVNDWDNTQRIAWYNAMFGISVNTGKTPTINAMLRIGNLFEAGATGVPALATGVNPLPASRTDPIANDSSGTPISCQNNYHILFTDGKTNQNGLPTLVGDQDATIPAFLQSVVGDPALDQVLPSFQAAAPGAPWPRPFVQGVAVSNTLADVATYYWARDLRPSLKNDVPSASGVSVALSPCRLTTATPPGPDAVCPRVAPFGPGVYSPGDTFYYPDLDWTQDVAWWQHVSFSALSFGAEGTLEAGDATTRASTVASIKDNASVNWPNLTQPNNPLYPKGNNAGAVAVDDLWHATVMSRGSFVYAKNPTEVSYGLAGILAGIQNQRKSRAGAAFSGQVLDASNNIVFIPTIERGWAGDLIKQEIDPATGAAIDPATGAPPAVPWWKAAVTLKAQIAPASFGDEPWMDETKRRVVTLTTSAGPGVAFRLANLTAAQKASLANTTLQQDKLVSYLRGGSTHTIVNTPPTPNTVLTIEGEGIGQFRKRYGALGDLSNAEPAIITPPDRNYVEASDEGYTDFKNTYKPVRSSAAGTCASAGRATAVVAPANDGMVHVFDAGPMPLRAEAGCSAIAAASGGGTELFAFIPKALFRGTAGDLATEDITAIQALAYQDGGVPIYHHHFYVDSSPRVADVDFGTTGAPDWRTIVVGGLGKGGNSYYALDVTDLSDVTDEASAGNKVLWEWSNADVRYTYGRPVIVKVRDTAGPVVCKPASGSTPAVKCRWVVIVTASYNNVSGLGKVFFLDAKTGALLSTVSTGVGSGASPSGLAQIHAFVANENNQVAEQVYGGDLEGNLWRIDVSASDQYKTATAVQFAVLTDPSGAVQPVTTAPQIEIDVNNGVDRYVFIGTGRLLHNDDLTTPASPQTQTMYAIRDGTLASFSTTGLPIQPRSTMAAVTADGCDPITGGAPNGWYHDLPNTAGPPPDSERIVIDVQANVNIAQYIGTKVQDDPCLISLPAVLYARDYTTGKSLLLDPGAPATTSSPFGNACVAGSAAIGNGIVASIGLPNGAVGNITIGRVQADGSQTLGAFISGEVPGTTPLNLQNPVTGPGSRLSWRILGAE